MWFKAVVPGGHVGAGKFEERIIYLWGDTLKGAYDILTEKTRGWKKSRGPMSLSKVDEKDWQFIEDLINATPHVNIKQVKTEGFFYFNRN